MFYHMNELLEQYKIAQEINCLILMFKKIINTEFNKELLCWIRVISWNQTKMTKSG